MNESKKCRLLYIDAAKGLSMLSIILGHLGIIGINKFVFTYHVPIFLIISGMFFVPKDGMIKKRFIGCIKPYLATSIIMLGFSVGRAFLKYILNREDFDGVLNCAADRFLSILYGSGSRHDFFGFEFEIIGAIWFLLALMWATIILWIILRKINNNIIQGTIVILAFAFAYLSAKYTWMPLSIQSGLSALLFVYVGYLTKNDKLKPIFMRNRKIIVLLCIAMWGLAIFFSYYNSNMSLVRSYFPNILINVIGACCASYLIITFLSFLDRIVIVADSKAYKLLCYFGKNSLILLCFHLIEFNYVPWHYNLQDSGSGSFSINYNNYRKTCMGHFLDLYDK